MASDHNDPAILAASAAPQRDRARDDQPASPPRRFTHMPSGAAFEERRDRTIRQAAIYTRFVRTMKVLLPVAAFAILAAMLLVAMIYQPDDSLTVSFTSVEQVENDLRMVNPRFTGVDAQRRPFLVTADAAIQDPTNPRAITLEALQADMTLSETTWVSVNADRGFLDTEAETLTLEGSIDVYSDTGYEFHMERAIVDFDSHSVMTETPVEGQGPLGALRADRFMAEDEGQVLRFDGNVRMRIFPPARSGE